MQLHLTALALPVLGSMQLASSHIVRTVLATTGNINDINVMDSSDSTDIKKNNDVFVIYMAVCIQIKK